MSLHSLFGLRQSRPTRRLKNTAGQPRAAGYRPRFEALENRLCMTGDAVGFIIDGNLDDSVRVSDPEQSVQRYVAPTAKLDVNDDRPLSPNDQVRVIDPNLQLKPTGPIDPRAAEFIPGGTWTHDDANGPGAWVHAEQSQGIIIEWLDVHLGGPATVPAGFESNLYADGHAVVGFIIDGNFDDVRRGGPNTAPETVGFVIEGSRGIDLGSGMISDSETAYGGMDNPSDIYVFNPQPDPPGSPLVDLLVSDEENFGAVVATSARATPIEQFFPQPDPSGVRGGIDDPSEIYGFNPQPDPPGAPLLRTRQPVALADLSAKRVAVSLASVSDPNEADLVELLARDAVE